MKTITIELTDSQERFLKFYLKGADITPIVQAYVNDFVSSKVNELYKPSLSIDQMIDEVIK